MGLEWSMLNILSDNSDEESTETKPDGTVITRRRNPWIRGLTITAATVVLISTIDGGSGVISHTLGRKCTKCNSKI